MNCPLTLFFQRRLELALVTMVFVMGFSLAHQAQAVDLTPPSGRVLLAVDGNIRNTTDGNRALFDRAQLEALGIDRLETSNPFTKGKNIFEGVLFSKILDTVDAEGKTISAKALDGYSADIPMEDIRKYPVLLAMKWNGKVMRARSKGPIWLVYPVDQFPELRSEEYSARSIWQLVKVTIK